MLIIAMFNSEETKTILVKLFWSEPSPVAVAASLSHTLGGRLSHQEPGKEEIVIKIYVKVISKSYFQIY